ncbi:MAG: rhomboid family intramembrane serine protease, partial [Litorivicinus sp.]
MRSPFYQHPSRMPWKATPLSAGLLVLTALIALLSNTGSNREWVVPLVMAPNVQFFVSEPWRVFTPALLHFSWPHWIFNALWMFAVGRLIEWRSPWVWLVVVLVSAVAGNLAQVWLGGTIWFGGLSGVVYGVLGYTALWDRRRRDQYAVPPMYLGLCLAFLAVGFSGLDRMLGMNLANFAHLGGLAGGVAVAAAHLAL